MDWARIPISGVVEGRTVILDKGYEVSKGTRVEGWASEEVAPVTSPGPMNVDEARRLLGPEGVAACTRRGTDIRKLEWEAWFTEAFSNRTWYRVIRHLDDADPWPIWLPLFAHLLRIVETDPNQAWLHLSDIEVVTTGLLERKGPGSTASNARLIALLMLRIMDFCEEGGRIGPHNLMDINLQARVVLAACVGVEERLLAPH